MLKCVVCSTPLTGRQLKYCSPICANAGSSYDQYQRKKNKEFVDGLSEKLKQEFGSLRVYAV